MKSLGSTPHESARRYKREPSKLEKQMNELERRSYASAARIELENLLAGSVPRDLIKLLSEEDVADLIEQANALPTTTPAAFEEDR